MIPVVKAKLLEGKKGLVVGIANEHSIAWGCAKAFRALGAELAVTYLNEKAKKYVEPLARELEAPILMPLDVNESGQMEAVFDSAFPGAQLIDDVVAAVDIKGFAGDELCRIVGQEGSSNAYIVNTH